MPRPSVTSVHTAIKAALIAAGVYAVDGPADDLPSDGGVVRQAAVLWPSPGFHAYTRVSGSSSGRIDRVLITCVGVTTFDALVTQPISEPNADPRRVSLAVEYTTITKG